MKLRKRLTFILLVTIAFFLQSTFFRWLNLGNIVPNLMLIVVVCIALIFGSTDGCILGFASGLILDIMYGRVLGLYALIFTVLGYFVGKFHRIYYRQDITLPLILIFGSDLLYNILLYVVLFLTRYRTNFFGYLWKLMIPEAFYTAVLGLFLYKLIVHICKPLLKTGGNLFD